MHLYLKHDMQRLLMFCSCAEELTDSILRLASAETIESAMNVISWAVTEYERHVEAVLYHIHKNELVQGLHKRSLIFIFEQLHPVCRKSIKRRIDDVLKGGCFTVMWVAGNSVPKPGSPRPTLTDLSEAVLLKIAGRLSGACFFQAGKLSIPVLARRGFFGFGERDLDGDGRADGAPAGLATLCVGRGPSGGY